MATAPPPRAPEEADLPDAPATEQFWDTYNKNLELPIATVATVLIHLAIFVVGIIFIRYLIGSATRKPVPIKPVIFVEGAANEDGDGGRAGDQGGPVGEKLDPQPNQQPITTAPDLSSPRENLAKWLPQEDAQNPSLLDDLARSEQAQRMAKMDDAIRKRMQAGFAKKNTGGGGSGASALPGSGDGEGGFGGNTTARRVLRWKLEFSTSGGDDYLDQLAAMKAIVAVPMPPNWKTLRVYPRPNDPKVFQSGDQSDFPAMSFVDDRKDSVAGVAEALGVDPATPYLMAFFPSATEEELARLEKGYRNHKVDDILSTSFTVTVRNGSPRIVVREQTLRKK